MPGVVMMMMGGHELLYYNILRLCKAGIAAAKILIFQHFSAIELQNTQVGFTRLVSP